MREIKFRFWYPVRKEMSEPAELGTIAHGYRGINFADGVIVPMQYTGLHDKQGKEIYEGDIINYDTEEGIVTAEVCWEESEDEDNNYIAGFVFKPFKSQDYPAGCDESCFEVIGNIWENGELLK